MSAPGALGACPKNTGYRRMFTKTCDKWPVVAPSEVNHDRFGAIERFAIRQFPVPTPAKAQQNRRWPGVTRRQQSVVNLTAFGVRALPGLPASRFCCNSLIS